MGRVLKRSYRQSGGGSITERVQTFILEHCINSIEDEGTVYNLTYIKNILKKVITAAESTHDVVLEGLYERLAYYLTSHMDDDLLKERSRICRQISFLCSSGHDNKCLSSMNLVVPLQCSLNMLEGDTGCALWPSSLFLSELILSYPMTFSNKFCFEVGSGVGLVGIMLKHVGASKVILTDGDMSTLANMKLNLELNHLASETMASQRTYESPNMVECKHLPWESASESELQTYHPDIVLGADIIYDPLYVPYLIRVLSILLKPLKFCSSEPKEGDMSCYRCTQSTEDRNGDNSQNEAKEAPNAYIATVIRNLETFNYFLRLAAEASLSVLDVTATMKPKNLLPYMLSYDRSTVHLYKVSFLCT
ncbi:putative uncharacterized protein DDB_G0277003 isoform X2 [Phoenix dactylifera]|uniref:Protein-lysine N-methyltransferase EEF2KMT n=1 Tax=Phoenix dactylifera TaxID=42345 RepID=A0A8B8J4Y2_PHODC|nr:putative uncharacterized protein DDB_G0277003 isoform X2 [Phoenix dactylifera]